MSDPNQYILDSIKTFVWSGFYDVEEVHELIGDLLEGDEDEKLLHAAVEPEFAKKATAEETWPDVTDCDRLDAAFTNLAEQRILALHNAGYTMSDGHDDAAQFLQDDPGTYDGYCFYQGQDVERAVAGGGLMIAFDHIDGDVPAKKEIGERVRAALLAEGLKVIWEGDPEKRIEVQPFDWKRRGAEGG